MEANFGGPALCGLFGRKGNTTNPSPHQTSPHKAGPPTHVRRAPAHHPVVEAGNQSVIVFVTVCTEQKRPILASEAAHQLVISAWLKAPAWNVGRYVIMPDHIHFFAAPNTLPPSGLPRWVSQWKAFVSRQFSMPQGSKLWQKNFWDTQLRQSENHSMKWNYVRQNPVRAGLVSQPDQWPYQGELNTLV